MQDALNSSTSLLDVGYRTQDPQYRAMVAHLPEVQSALVALKQAVTAGQKTATPQTAPLYKECLHPMGQTTVRLTAAIKSKGQSQYGDIVALLQGDPDDPSKENWLNKIHEACVNRLNAQVQDAAIAEPAGRLDALHTAMLTELAAIDLTVSHRLAETEMKFPKATMNTLLYQVNLFSLSPVVVFDVAHLGPANSSLGTRYAAGGGVRLTLVSQVQFTLGYAANPKRLPGEGKGALFFSMDLRDLFR